MLQSCTGVSEGPCDIIVWWDYRHIHTAFKLVLSYSMISNLAPVSERLKVSSLFHLWPTDECVQKWAWRWHHSDLTHHRVYLTVARWEVKVPEFSKYTITSSPLIIDLMKSCTVTSWSCVGGWRGWCGTPPPQVESHPPSSLLWTPAHGTPPADQSLTAQTQSSVWHQGDTASTSSTTCHHWHHWLSNSYSLSLTVSSLYR